MSDIQDEAYTEMCLENERLEKALSIAYAEYRKLDDKLEHALRTIEEISLLITRAADALEAFSNEFNRSPREQSYPSCSDLIAYLRKAAG